MEQEEAPVVVEQWHIDDHLLQSYPVGQVTEMQIAPTDLPSQFEPFVNFNEQSFFGTNPDLDALFSTLPLDEGDTRENTTQILSTRPGGTITDEEFVFEPTLNPWTHRR